ncbi:MAG TPA: hypothetical protein VGW75_14035 [Solirubrobacteraceae bacterium]|jgi:hypothetical protein|nr:hypothetical protein [Solirubrobacteraceae bacterium]
MSTAPERSRARRTLVAILRYAPPVLAWGSVTELMTGGEGFDVLHALGFSAAFAAVTFGWRWVDAAWHPSPSRRRFGGVYESRSRLGGGSSRSR